MTDPITTEDLYGTSKEGQRGSSASPLPVEETPEILSVDSLKTESTPAPSVSPDSNSSPFSPIQRPLQQGAQSTPPASVQKGSGCLHSIGVAIIFIALFITGIWLSSFLREFLPSDFSVNSPTAQLTPRDTPVSTESATAVSNGSLATWKTYEVISGATKLPVSGVNFKLPADVLKPICDGTNCASQGTYLPGGTRFTVAARGAGQLLADSRGGSISDVGGVTFTTKQSTVGGRVATEFTGTFTGRTISGYTFTRMRGVMIVLNDTTSIEVNHFVPAGITADFDTDDTLFNSILQTFMIAGGTQIIPSVSPTVSSTAATSSGY